MSVLDVTTDQLWLAQVHPVEGSQSNSESEDQLTFLGGAATSAAELHKNLHVVFMHTETTPVLDFISDPAFGPQGSRDPINELHTLSSQLSFASDDFPNAHP